MWKLMVILCFHGYVNPDYCEKPSPVAVYQPASGCGYTDCGYEHCVQEAERISKDMVHAFCVPEVKP